MAHALDDVQPRIRHLRGQRLGVCGGEDGVLAAVDHQGGRCDRGQRRESFCGDLAAGEVVVAGCGGMVSPLVGAFDGPSCGLVEGRTSPLSTRQVCRSASAIQLVREPAAQRQLACGADGRDRQRRSSSNAVPTSPWDIFLQSREIKVLGVEVDAQIPLSARQLSPTVSRRRASALEISDRLGGAPTIAVRRPKNPADL